MRNSFIDELTNNFFSTVVTDVYEKIFLFEYCMMDQILQIDVIFCARKKNQQNNLKCTFTILIFKYILEIFFFKVIKSNSKVIVNYTSF